MNKRALQVNELIQQELAKLMLREVEFPENCIVTITKVEVDEEIRHATAYVGIVPDTLEKEVSRILKKTRGHLQFLLNRQLAMQHVPEIHFRKVDPDDPVTKIEEILDTLHREERNPS